MVNRGVQDRDTAVFQQYGDITVGGERRRQWASGVVRDWENERIRSVISGWMYN